MGVRILKAGLFTTVQDLGRGGYQNVGFPVSGVMDRRSFRLANMLIDNPENEAVLEFALTGPTLEFTSDTIISITGGDFNPTINDKEVSMYTAIYAHKGDILKFGCAKTGSYGYIAFSSRLDIPVFMGSRSTYEKCSAGGYKGRKLREGDHIWFRVKKRYIPYFLSRHLEKEDFSSNDITLRVVMGPQDDFFTKDGIKSFLTEEYNVTSEFDRMGCRLDGKAIEHKNRADIISDGMVLGSIQVPAHGKPIIALADRQTVGGYTKIATVISTDIPKLVQSKEGDKVHFKMVTIDEAQDIYINEIRKYEKMRKEIHVPCREVLKPRAASQRIEKLFN